MRPTGSAAAELHEAFRPTQIGEFPESWPILTIGDLFDIQQGKALSPAARRGVNPKPFLRTSNILWGRLALAELDRMDFSEEERERLALEPGDLLVCEGGEIGRTAVWLGELVDCLYQNHLHRLRRRTDEVEPEFVMYWMQAALMRLGLYGGVGNRTTIPNLSGARLKQLPLPLPPLEEQHAIARVLRTIQSAVEVQDRMVAKLKELKAATMAKLFREGLRGEPLKQTEIGEIPESWEMRPLWDLCLPTRTADPSQRPLETFRYIDVSSISSEDLEVQSTALHTGATAPSRARKPVRSGDVILATVRPTLRRVALIDETLDGSVVSTAFCVLRANPSLLVPEFLYSVGCEELAREFEAIQRGASYPAVTDGDVLDRLVPMPPLSEQKEMSKILSRQGERLRLARRRCQALRSLFGSMLELLMTGQLRIGIPHGDSPQEIGNA